MDILTPPKNLRLNQYEDLVLLSWNRSYLNNLITDYMYYRIHQAEESFEDVMPYNYDRLKGYSKDMGNTLVLNREDQLSIKMYHLITNTTYYFTIIAHDGGIDSPPSEEANIYIQNYDSKTST